MTPRIGSNTTRLQTKSSRRKSNVPDRFVLNFEACAVQVLDLCGFLRKCVHKFPRLS